MNRSPEHCKAGGGLEVRPPDISRGRFWESFLFVLLMAVSNLHLAGPGWVAQPSYIPVAVAAGEWWRIPLHPFAHVSVYHLLLDGAAFLVLYLGLRERRWFCRLGLVVAAGIGSLLFSLRLAPEVEWLGLCGLSGIGHGLMAVTALELIRDRDWVGWPFLIGVAAKATWEAVTGHVVLEHWHLGSVGSPVVVSHLGGILGAAAFWAIVEGFALWRRRAVRSRGDPEYPGVQAHYGLNGF